MPGKIGPYHNYERGSKMKRALIIALALSAVLGLAACGDTADRSDNTKDGVIGDGLKQDMQDMKNGLDNMMDPDSSHSGSTANSGTAGR